MALLIFILLALFFTLIHPRGFSAFALGSSILTTQKSIIDYLQFFAINLKTLFFYEPVVSIVSLIGMIFLWFKSKRLLLLALSWPVFYTSILYFVNYVDFSEDVLQVRFMIVIFPWLMILTGFTVDRLISKLRNPLKITIVSLLLVFSFTTALQYDRLLDQKDTRTMAKEWVEENISAKAKIISNWSGINPVPTKEAILFQKEMDKSSLRVADEVLLSLDDDNYPEPAYNILRAAYIDKEKLLIGQDYQYFLVAFWDENNLSQEEKSIIQKARLIQEFKQGRGEKAEDINGDFIRPIFMLFSLERPGPTIKIYEL